MTVFIGGAWPYANGSLHIGHIASLLSGDILARYFRLKGEEVLYVSGSDCHGTPIAIRANQENRSPKEITDYFHDEFKSCFQQLGFSYDLYSRTDQEHHHQVVQDLFLQLYENGLIYKREVKQTFCEQCHQFLPDRYVEGICPNCGNGARGDQCEHCSAILDPLELQDKHCKLCGNRPVERNTDHLYFALSKFQGSLEAYLTEAKHWRDNAVQLTARYLKEGLQDRAVTRDLQWGINVPIAGFENKKIYVWIDAVCGYLSASKQWAERNGGNWQQFWSREVTAYYVQGKDNIPFHSIIWPAILLGADGGLHLPDRILSNEYLTIEGKKISTSRNWAVWVPYLLEHYSADSIRYFLTINAPEKRDTDFSWREFINSHNGELLGAFGNFVQRTLKFVEKFFQAQVPLSTIDPTKRQQIDQLYEEVGVKIEAGECKPALEQLFSFIRSANKYFDEQKPWQQVNQEPEQCAQTIFTCVQIIANLSNLASPFLPFTCEKIRANLGIAAPGWNYLEIDPLKTIEPLALLFEPIDKGRIEEEVRKLQT
ncbi:MAG: methionyl-tRNA synthetase [Bacilli bacterium]|nr:methionyl-tRNA synthetase [Bacilli bacterium]